MFDYKLVITDLKQRRQIHRLARKSLTILLISLTDNRISCKLFLYLSLFLFSLHIKLIFLFTHQPPTSHRMVHNDHLFLRLLFLYFRQIAFLRKNKKQSFKILTNIQLSKLFILILSQSFIMLNYSTWVYSQTILLLKIGCSTLLG